MHIPPMIDDYYRAALDALKREVDETPDAKAIAMDPAEWAQYLVAKYGMEAIEADFAAIRMEETTDNGYPAILVRVPVEPTDTFQVIAKKGLAGQAPWLGFDYHTFFSDRYPGTIGQVVPQREGEVNQAKRRIEEYVRSLNAAIEHANKTFPGQVQQIIVSRQEAIRAKDSRLEALSAAAGIPLVKRADAATVIPTAVRVREKIAPIVPPTPKLQQRPVLDRDKFDAIVEIIDNQCRQFERTPTAFQGMTEEALRDVMLSSLNAVFKGAAGGELFRVLGKTDIHLRISQGEVFIAELKVWGGPASLAEAVAQLLDRLTWRDAYGVVVILSKNVDFGGVLGSIEATLPELPRAVKPSFRKHAANVFVSRFTLPSDASTQVEVHVRTYNLYTPRPSGRTA